MLNRWRTALPLAVVLVFVLVGGLALATPHAVTASGLQSINEKDRVALPDNVHPLAKREFEIRRADLDLPMERMILMLAQRPGAQAQLDRHLAAQHDPTSPQYHRWLTPEQFGARFGLRDADLALVTNWLQSHGFTIDEVAKGRGWINFSGTVAQVERAFATEIHDYEVEGKIRHANAIAPSIPRALESLVQGVVTLHSFPVPSQHGDLRKVSPEELSPDYTDATGVHFLAPADFATIYDLNSVYNAGINGTGRTIGIVGRTDIRLADVQYFRSFFGLPVNDPGFIHNGTDPGIVSPDEETEGDLDVEWAGAVGRNATVKFVISQSTAATDGVHLSAQYIVNNNLADSMSTSFGWCESSMGPAELTFYNNIWAQAASQGITSFVSSGDAGAAGCNKGGDMTGSGRAVSGICSTPFNVCVGGSQFNDTTGTYWSSTNNPTTRASALSYIPEIAWNESGNVSGGSHLWSSGGGASTIYAKPAWQSAPGVPADGKRDIPDVSLTSAGHDGYLIIQGHTATVQGLFSLGGTSAASPSFAGLMSLIVQKTGLRQGNANTVLYPMAKAQLAGTGVAAFHDVTSGNNSVPGVTGLTCGTGYDEVTGLGSVDGAVLVNNWLPPNFTVSASPSAISIGIGTSGNVSITTAISGGFNSAIALTATGLPSGVTASFSPSSIAAPGAGTSTLTLTVSSSTVPGTYSIMVIGSGGFNRIAPVTLTVLGTPNFTIAATPAAVSIGQGSSGNSTISTTISGGFNSAIMLSASGLPSGVTPVFNPSSIAAPGAGSSILTLVVGATAAPGISTITIKGIGGGITHTATITLTVTSTAPPDFTVSASPSATTIGTGTSGNVSITTAISGGFNSAITLTAVGAPSSGVTASVSPSSIAAPGNGTSTLTITVSSFTSPGTYSIMVIGNGGGFNRTTSVTLTVP
jgi:hypothetical protein